MTTIRKFATAQNSNIGEEVSAVFVRERFRFQNSDGDVVIATAWRNGEASDPISIKGPADADELVAGQTYRFFGKWTSYKNKRTGDTEAQLAFTSFVVEQPADREGIIAYLKSAGDGFGIGQSRAVKLWDLYGSDAVRVCREEPDRVIRSLAAEGLRVNESSFHLFVAGLVRMQKTEAATIDCNAILANTGCRKTLTRSLLRDYGNSAALRLRRNPFLVTDYTGHGFELADKLWKRLKLPMHKLRRQAYAAWWTVKRDNQNTWSPRSHVEKEVAKLIGSKSRPAKAVELAIRAGLLVEERTDGVNGPIAKGGNVRWLALPQDHHNERKIAEYLAAAALEKHDWPDADAGEIENVDGEQPGALAKCLTGMIAILGGRPGTGKTFCAANLIKACVKKFGERQIGIGAPTNLAAMRLNQVMAGYGVKVKARTNHSLLGFPDRIGEDWRHNERNKWPCKVMIFDESSMKDASIFRAILAARPRGCMILFIGDHNQLPPVQSGKPFFDCIRAGLPYAELKEIRRNSGGIVEACAAIADGKTWGPGDNLELIQTDSEEQQQAAIERTLIEVDRIGLDPVWDSRIIVARNVRRRSLNKWLQGLLNPTNSAISGSPFRVCDKVICRETSEFKVIGGGGSTDADDGDGGDRTNERMAKVPNGELGKVVSVDERSMVVELLVSKSLVLVPRFPVDSTTKVTDDDDKPETDEADKTGTGCAWELAYAVTFHSSQGSEFPWPIMVATSADAALGSRELVYTGISRGKNRCTLIGLKSTWDKFCRNVSLLKRKTLLTERILIERAKMQLGEI